MTDYPQWHPVIHHTLVLVFLLLILLLPIVYIRTRQPPYWVLLIVLCFFAFIYMAYWTWLCCLSRQRRRLEPKEDSLFLRTSVDHQANDTHGDTLGDTASGAGQYNPSTVGIPPSSYIRLQPAGSSSPSTLRVQPNGDAYRPSSSSIQSSTIEHNSSMIEHPPPAYHASFEHIAIEFTSQPSPPSYHSTKDEEDDLHPRL